MDKQKQIEQMVKTMGNWAQRNNMCWNDGHAKSLAEALSEEYQPKIPENAVVLTEEELDNIKNAKYCSGLIAGQEQGSKETAEKFAERLKELEEALLDMVVQFCQMGEYGKLKHAFMSAEEQAFDVLDIKYGEKVDKVYKRFNKKWSRPIDEICKEFTGGENSKNE